jgi:multidrug efflux pump subunit AcrB
MIGNILAMVFASMVNYDPKSYGLNDAQAAQFQESYMTSMIIYGVGLLVNIIVICGASMYNACLIMLGVLWILVELGFSIYYQTTLPKDQYPVYGIIGSVIWDGLILYPHIVLISEIRNGIMKPETYARERFSCCCV